ncbi:MAG: CpeT protein [Saprospiraceae bacterium]
MKTQRYLIGAWKDKSIFTKIKPSEVSLKEGCEVVLKKQKDGSFSGKTGAESCKSSFRGASFATSEVTIVPEKIVSWDQGWNDNGEQIWGATLAGYEFLKVK